MKKTLILFLCVSLLLCGCDKVSRESEKTTTTPSKTTNQTTEKETETTYENIPTAEDILIQLKSKNENIVKIIVYTEETDPNELLGRPHNYISKANFSDCRAEQYDDEFLVGGTVEVFENEKDCQNRYEYLNSINDGSMGLLGLNQYIYKYDKIIFRIDYDLTPKQAEEYHNQMNFIMSQYQYVDINEIPSDKDDNSSTEQTTSETAELTTELQTEKETQPVIQPTQPQTETPTPAPTEPPTQKPTEKPTPAPTEAPTEKPVTVSDIQILEEYTYSDGFWYTYHFVVVKNNSNKPVTISTSTLAYKSDGTLISVDEGYVDIVGSGCTTIYYEAFETTEEISYYDTEMTVDTDVWYECGLNGLSYTQTNIEDGAIFQVTNNGNNAVDFVEGYALFIKDGKVVSWESNYFTDDDYEIKVGKTISKQFSAYEEFDTVKFYLTGRID